MRHLGINIEIILVVVKGVTLFFWGKYVFAAFVGALPATPDVQLNTPVCH
jgi:hypothetical protein